MNANSDKAEARDEVNEGGRVGLHRLVSLGRSDDLEEIHQLAAAGDRGEEHRLHLRQRPTLRTVEIDPSQVNDIVPEACNPLAVILGARRGPLQLHPRGLGDTLEIERAGDRVVTDDHIYPEPVVVSVRLSNNTKCSRRRVDHPTLGNRERESRDARNQGTGVLSVCHRQTLVRCEDRAYQHEPGSLPVLARTELFTINHADRVRPLGPREVAAT